MLAPTLKKNIGDKTMYPKKFTTFSSLRKFSVGNRLRATMPPKIALMAAKLSKTKLPRTTKEKNINIIRTGRIKPKLILLLNTCFILEAIFTKTRVRTRIPTKSKTTSEGSGKP